jgi:hypothetical protein
VPVKLCVEAWALEEFKRMQRASLLKPRLMAIAEGRGSACLDLDPAEGIITTLTPNS